MCIRDRPWTQNSGAPAPDGRIARTGPVGSKPASPEPSRSRSVRRRRAVDRAGSAAEPVAAAASRSTVLRVKTSDSAISRPASRARATTRTERRLSPPRSKKSSSTPRRSRPRTSRKTSRRTRSFAVRGARPGAVGASSSGAGSALTSSFPLAVSGSSGRVTIAAGTMCRGSSRPACSRRWRASTRATPGTGTT